MQFKPKYSGGENLIIVRKHKLEVQGSYGQYFFFLGNSNAFFFFLKKPKLKHTV